MSVVIFGDMFSFPEGDAATNRVLTFAKGFYENGLKVHVICFGNEYIEKGDGVFDGINYYHPFGQAKRHKYFIVRRYQKFIKYFTTISLVKKLNDDDRIIAINILTNLILTHFYTWFLSRLFRTKFIVECSEHPLRHYQKNALMKLSGKIKFFLESRVSDGIYCISRFLMDYHSDHGIDRRKLLLVPSTVDPSRFSEKGDSPFPFRYIGYFGALTFKRDNVDLLIRAYAIVSERHPDIRLVLGGFCSDEERTGIKDLIAELNIGEKTTLLEYLGRDEVLNYITHAYVLVMVRSNNMEAMASYPSKLTEYVATSKPVVTVNVGEISDYYTDGVNAYLVEPENVNALSEKLDFVLDNYESALKVSSKGRELIMTTFNYNYQARRMMEFIDTLQ